MAWKLQWNAADTNYRRGAEEQKSYERLVSICLYILAALFLKFKSHVLLSTVLPAW